LKNNEEVKQYSLSTMLNSIDTPNNSKKYIVSRSAIKEYDNTKEFVTLSTKLYIQSNDITFKENISLSSSRDSISYFGNFENNLEKRISKCKKRIINLLTNEDVIVGYSSRSQDYMARLILNNEENLVKEAISQLFIENVDNFDFTYKLIEVMSNLEYKKLYPNNTFIAFSSVNHKDVRIQEAAIASIEKWEDSRNLKYLKNIDYTTEWIEEYANNVINYLESCE